MNHRVMYPAIIAVIAMTQGWRASAETPQGAPVASEPAAAVPAAQPPAPEPPKTPEDQLRAQLDSTTWSVQLTPAGSAEAKPKKDAISFTKRQVASDFMGKSGYPASNYSLTIGDDGRGVWETMQTKDGEGVAFWRGEFDGTTMRGVLSKHPVEGAVEDYNFAGQVDGGRVITIPARAVKAPVAAAQPAKAPQAPAAAAPAAKPAGSEPAAKKKRKWF